MTKRIAPVPRGYRTVTPQLVVRGADAALTYYADVFAATVLSRHAADDGFSVLQAEIKIGNSIIRLMDEMPTFGLLSPIGFGGTAVGIHLYMPNADEIWDRALESGAGVLVPFADTPWGERYGKFIDPFGHVWSVSRRIAKKNAPKKNAATSDATEVAATPPANDDAGLAGAFSVHEPQADSPVPSVEKEMAALTAASTETNVA